MLRSDHTPSHRISDDASQKPLHVWFEPIPLCNCIVSCGSFRFHCHREILAINSRFFYEVYAGLGSADQSRHPRQHIQQTPPARHDFIMRHHSSTSDGEHSANQPDYDRGLDEDCTESACVLPDRYEGEHLFIVLLMMYHRLPRTACTTSEITAGTALPARDSRGPASSGGLPSSGYADADVLSTAGLSSSHGELRPEGMAVGRLDSRLHTLNVHAVCSLAHFLQADEVQQQCETLLMHTITQRLESAETVPTNDAFSRSDTTLRVALLHPGGYGDANAAHSTGRGGRRAPPDVETEANTAAAGDGAGIHDEHTHQVQQLLVQYVAQELLFADQHHLVKMTNLCINQLALWLARSDSYRHIAEWYSHLKQPISGPIQPQLEQPDSPLLRRDATGLLVVNGPYFSQSIAVGWPHAGAGHSEQVPEARPDRMHTVWQHLLTGVSGRTALCLLDAVSRCALSWSMKQEEQHRQQVLRSAAQADHALSSLTAAMRLTQQLLDQMTVSAEPSADIAQSPPPSSPVTTASAVPRESDDGVLHNYHRVVHNSLRAATDGPGTESSDGVSLSEMLYVLTRLRARLSAAAAALVDTGTEG